MKTMHKSNLAIHNPVSAEPTPERDFRDDSIQAADELLAMTISELRCQLESQYTALLTVLSEQPSDVEKDVLRPTVGQSALARSLHCKVAEIRAITRGVVQTTERLTIR